MPAPGLSRVDRVLYRTLQKLARTFDRNPALKALISRNLASPLPPTLDGLVARFLGSSDALYYWPAPVGQPQVCVADAVRHAFRHPALGPEQEGAFAATRYLSGLLAIARKHGMLPEAGQGLSAAAGATAAEQGEEQQQQLEASSSSGTGATASSGESSSNSLEVVSVPERGNVLVAHPALNGIFGRSVVLLCSHELQQGAYGVIVNKPLGTDLQHLYARLDQLQGGSGGGGGAAAGGAFGALGAGGASALFGQGGPAAPGAGGILPSGSGEQEQAAAAAAAAAGAGGAEDDDIPAERLQQMADLLEWRDRLGLAAPAAAALQQQQPPETDEYGNWLEPSSFESFDQDSSADEAGPYAVSDSEDEEQRAFQEGLAASALGQEWSFGPGADPEGVADALIEALRRAGGGTVVMCDTEGQLWSHHLPAEMANSEEEDELSSGSESESDPLTGWVTAASLVDEGPEAIADLVLSSLTPQDRLLLQRQAELAAEAAHGPAALEASSSGGGGSSSSDATAAHPSHRVAADKVQRMQQVVDYLIASASSDSQLKGAAARQQEQRQPGEQQAGEQQAEQQDEQRQQWLQQLEGVPGSGAAAARAELGSMGWQAGESALGGAAGAAGAAGEPSGSGAKGGTAHTVTQLMGLFKASPLFRGGPVPGVQVLHRRPKLGGKLVLPPWGSTGAAAEAAVATAIAVEDTAEGAAQPGGEALEGGLVVGADLARAQELLDSGYLSPSDVRVIVGDAAWVPQQLEGEIARGTWAVARAAPDFLDLFTPVPPAPQPQQAAEGGPGGAPGAMLALGRSAAAVSARDYEDRMWGKCLSALGPECAALASVPRGVWQDIERLEV